MRNLILFAFAVFASLSPPAKAADESRPNIIFLLTDDQTQLAAGCYGNTQIHTPNLDRLAAEGARFTNHYNTTSICMASRCCVLTGLFEYRHGCNFDHGDLARNFVAGAYPVRLREAGYFTGFAGKIGFLIEGEPFEALAPLFDRFAGGPGQTFYETAKNPAIAAYADRHPHSTRAYAAWAADFLKEAKQSGKPFCLSISFKAPHLPFTPDPTDVARYKGETFTKPANYGTDNAQQLAPQVRTSRAYNDYRFWITDYEKSIADYYALISGVDDALGSIRAALQDEGLAANTVIIYTSDNGYSCGAHGLGDKVLPYEEASKSPLIIFDPRLARERIGLVCDAVTANVDMAPTILSFAGLPIPDGLDGKDLRPLLDNPKGKVRDFLPLFNFWGVPSAQSMAIVTPEWKYIYWYYGGEGMQPQEELFHEEKDRLELQPLTSQGDAPEELESLRQYYDLQLASVARDAVKDHGYEAYGTLFDRRIGWEQKATLVKSAKPEKTPKPGKKAKGKEQEKSAND